MPTDQPLYPGEQEIPLSSHTLTSSGCVNAPYAIDDDPTTPAIFELPSYSYDPGSPVVGLRADFYQPPGIAPNSSFGGHDFVPTIFDAENYQFTLQYPNMDIAYPNPPTPPDPRIVAGAYFGIIFSGFILAQYTETYTFYSHTDDGVRLTIGGQVVFDGLSENAGEYSGSITLTAGVPTPFKAEFFQDGYLYSYTHLSWSSASQAFEIVPASAFVAASPIMPRFLRVDWGYDAFISRVRLKMTGAGVPNAAVDFESSLGLIEYGPPPPEIPLPYFPFWEDDDIHSVTLNPPVLARGVVFYPDQFLETAGLTPSQYPEVDLYQLQVYETHDPGAIPMTLPARKRARVGVQAISIYPWNGAAGPYDATTADTFAALGTFDLGATSKSAIIKGGETVHSLGGFETDRESKLSISVKMWDLRALNLLLGGSFVLSPANGNGPEVQYVSSNFTDRAPYVRIVGLSNNGDGTDSYVICKAKIDGQITVAQLERDKEADLKFDVMPFWDYTYVRQDGTVGGIWEDIFIDSNTMIPAFHS